MAVAGGYALLLIFSGALFARRRRSSEEYFRGGGRVAWWAAGISLLATALSAATFIGGPQQSYQGDLSYLISNLGSILAILVVALFFIPVYYRYKLSTVYGLIGLRYGTTARQWTAGVYFSGRLFASGSRLYIAALPLSLILFGDTHLKNLFLSIAILTIVGIFYTWVGGIRSVIWSDVLQTIIFTGAAVVALVVLWDRIPLTSGEIWDALSDPGESSPSKLRILKWVGEGWGPSNNYTLLTALTGFFILNLGAYGADQDLAQRLLACRRPVEGSKAALGGILLGLPITFLFLTVGLLLWIFYQRGDLMEGAAPGYIPAPREVFLKFILREMPPGLRGLMMSGLFAAALSTLNSGINAMGSSFVYDFYRPLRPGRSEEHYLRIGMVSVVVVGIGLGLVAAGCALWQHFRPQTTLIDFALSVMTFAYSGLAAVYLTAIFTNRGSARSIIFALLVGWMSVLVMQIFLSQRLAFPWQLTLGFLLSLGCALLGKEELQPASKLNSEMSNQNPSF
ncbi:MAG: sodium:solute symporter [bacterium]